MNHYKNKYKYDKVSALINYDNTTGKLFAVFVKGSSLTLLGASVLPSSKFESGGRRVKYTYVIRCAIWYHLYNLKNVKNTHGGV